MNHATGAGEISQSGVASSDAECGPSARDDAATCVERQLRPGLLCVGREARRTATVNEELPELLRSAAA